MGLSIVIPVYNEGKNLEELLKRINKSFKKNNFEVIIVDDDSNDGSKDKLKNLKKKFKKLKFYIRKKKPRDLSKSCTVGFSKAKFKNILVMDGDLQHKPEEIKRLYKKFENSKSDFVVGIRNLLEKKNEGLGLVRLTTSIILIYIVNITLGFKTKDPMSGFFIFKKKIYTQNKKNLFNKGYKILLDLIYSSKNYDVTDISINFKSRREGFSKMSLKIILLLFMIILQKFIKKTFNSF